MGHALVVDGKFIQKEVHEAVQAYNRGDGEAFGKAVGEVCGSEGAVS